MGNLVNRIVRKPRSSVEPDVDMTENEAEENPRILRCSLAGKRGKNDPDDYDNSPRSKLKGIHSAKKIKTSMKSIALDEEKEAQVTKLPKRYIEFPNREQHLKSFLKLFDDEEIQDFMWNDGCAKLIDKYLLAMVYVYFRRAELATKSYSRLNFFAALFLAHDMEEDDEEIKQEIFPWALGHRWKISYRSLIKRRDNLLKRMNFRSLVSNLTCLEVFELCPNHPLWLRERQAHHGGASRLYPPEDEMPYNPKGPGRSPTFCSECTLQMYDEIVMQGSNNTSKKIPPLPGSVLPLYSQKSRFQGETNSEFYQTEE